MKKIIISPFSQKLRSGKQNPKDYPFWDHVISSLQEFKEYYITQIGRSDETKLNHIDDVKFNLNFKDLKQLILEHDFWISVDNFLPHFCNTFNSRGIVLFSQSDPNIFGYKQNINLLKDRKYLRTNQFNSWDECDYITDAFISPLIVTAAIINWRK